MFGVVRLVVHAAGEALNSLVAVEDTTACQVGVRVLVGRFWLVLGPGCAALCCATLNG